MDSDSHARPPEEQRTVKPFDPLALDRTVIALPLLNSMRADLEQFDYVKKHFADALDRYNAALMYNSAYPGGLAAAHKWAAAAVREASKKALASAERRLESPPEGLKAIYQRALDELRKAIAEQVVEPAQEGAAFGFARVHAAVAHRLMMMNERAAARDEKAGGQTPIVAFLPHRFEVIIDLNLEHPQGRSAAREWVLANIDVAKERAGVRDAGQGIHFEKSESQAQYLFARLEARAIRELVALDLEEAKARGQAEHKAGRPHAKANTARFRAIFHIWPDFEISACINKSIATVKADAAQVSFSARGSGITWAVMDSGIEAGHDHFKFHQNIDVTSPWHKDFTTDGAGPFDDANGHGTHVAGIIAGEWRVPPGTPENKRPIAVSRLLRKDTGDVEYEATRLDTISGMAPECRLVSLRVLDEDGKGSVSSIIAAINHVQEINGHGRRLLIHGVNLSVGHTFEPEWFACGQSPLCVEIDRLVKSGVVVVVAAGNTGYGTLSSSIGATSAGMALTINDPGNADLAITVGATHRDMPHVYGVSYFSSKGPTGDGRLKPDLVAPGEKIISCAAGRLKEEGANRMKCHYVETSGTSMAAPHVSGVVAAFLSVRREFIGQAERVKKIFVGTATDLKRDRYFQGAGLVDLMRAIQSV
jgi:subtilisin family serine protease